MIDLLEIPELRAEKNRALATMGPSRIRFFTPKPEFFVHHLKEFARINLVDCGTGTCDLPIEAGKWGYNMIGIDAGGRILGKPMLQMDAMDFDFSPNTWPIICRPSHDGWCELTIKRALKLGANVLYVGLQKNFKSDVGYKLSRIGKKIAKNVGHDGEHLWRFQP